MPEERKELPRIMTLKELAQFLGVNTSTVYKLVRNTKLPAFKIGSDWRFNTEQIKGWCGEGNKARSKVLKITRKV